MNNRSEQCPTLLHGNVFRRLFPQLSLPKSLIYEKALKECNALRQLSMQHMQNGDRRASTVENSSE